MMHARDFHDFYNTLITRPLKRELESGARGRTLSNYFEFEELERLPDVRVVGLGKVEEADREIAVELLGWLQKITPEKILDDIKSTLDQHYNKGLVTASPEHSYNHKSEHVHISAHRSKGPDKPVTTFLTPARSHGATKEGYEGVYYPTYYVELAAQ